MSVITTKREYKAARRADASGSGPTLEERPPARFPGAAAKFALFGEVLQTGLLIALVGILVITLPAALAGGIRHLRRYLHAEASPMRYFWHDVRSALTGGLIVGLIGAVLAAILVLDMNLAGSGLLPGGAAIAIVGWAGLVVGAVALLAAAGAWTPERGWRAAVRSVPALIRSDIRGALFLASAAVFVGVATWMLVPLIVPALGCAALAVVAIPERRRAH